MRAWTWIRRNALMLYAAVAVAYMLAPIIVVALFSFDDTRLGKLDYAWSGFSLDAWKDAFANEAVNDAMVTSLQLAGLATLGSTIIGTGNSFATPHIAGLVARIRATYPTATPFEVKALLASGAADPSGR